MLYISGPAYVLFRELFGYYLLVVASHMDWSVHYWRWSVFTVVNIGFWILVFGLLSFAVNRISRKPPL